MISCLCPTTQRWDWCPWRCCRPSTSPWEVTVSPGTMSTTTWSVSPTRAPSTRTWPRPGTCSSSFNLCCPRNSTKQYQYSISWCSEVFENPQKFVLSDGIQNSCWRLQDPDPEVQRPTRDFLPGVNMVFQVTITSFANPALCFTQPRVFYLHVSEHAEEE